MVPCQKSLLDYHLLFADCAACEREAPETFGWDADADQWVTRAQPESAEGRRAALRAMQCCPTYAIHATDLVRLAHLQVACHGLPCQTLARGSGSKGSCWQLGL